MQFCPGTFQGNPDSGLSKVRFRIRCQNYSQGVDGSVLPLSQNLCISPVKTCPLGSRNIREPVLYVILKHTKTGRAVDSIVRLDPTAKIRKFLEERQRAWIELIRDVVRVGTPRKRCVDTVSQRTDTQGVQFVVGVGIRFPCRGRLDLGKGVESVVRLETGICLVQL